MHKIRTTILIIGISIAWRDLLSQSCVEPSQNKLRDLSAYVSKRYHVGSSSKLELLEKKKFNEACYWAFHYQISTSTNEGKKSKTELTLFLSPDQHYLSTSLLDLAVDPLAEEKTRNARLMQTLEANDPPAVGEKNAPITIVEFSDFQCPFCKSMSSVLRDQLTPDERKQVRIVFRHYPLSIHPWARDAAEVAACTALQSDDAFWKIHDYLFENQGSITRDTLQANISSYAVEHAGVDKAQLDNCLKRRLTEGEVSQDMELGVTNGVHVTPTLFINGTRYDGAKDVTQLRAIIAQIHASPE